MWGLSPANGIRAPPSAAYVPVVGRVTGKTLAVTHILFPSGTHYKADSLKLCLQQLEALSLNNQVIQNTKVSPMGCIQPDFKDLIITHFWNVRQIPANSHPSAKKIFHQ